VEQPTTGSFQRVLKQQADAGSLVLFPEPDFKRLLAKGTSRWARDLDLLVESFGSLSLCDVEGLAKLLQNECRFAEQLLLVNPAGSPDRPQAEFTANALAGWRALLSRLFQARPRSEPQLIQASGDALQMLGALRREAGPVRTLNSVLLASKVALDLHGCSLRPEREISGRVMGEAMVITAALVERSDEVAKLVLEVDLQRRAGVMLRKIQNRGPIRQRTLYRTYRRQRKVRHGPALKFLIQTDQVRERADKLLEATSSSTVASRSTTGF
jgi:hypothetical protein